VWLKCPGERWLPGLFVALKRLGCIPVRGIHNLMITERRIDATDRVKKVHVECNDAVIQTMSAEFTTTRGGDSGHGAYMEIGFDFGGGWAEVSVKDDHNPEARSVARSLTLKVSGDAEIRFMAQFLRVLADEVEGFIKL
jgi:hypothetical protein